MWSWGGTIRTFRAPKRLHHATRRARMDWFYVYFVGFLILIAFAAVCAANM